MRGFPLHSSPEQTLLFWNKRWIRTTNRLFKRQLALLFAYFATNITCCSCCSTKFYPCRIQHVIYLSPTGYSIMPNDTWLSPDSVRHCVLALACDSDIPHYPFPSEMASWYLGRRHHPLLFACPRSRLGRRVNIRSFPRLASFLSPPLLSVRPLSPERGGLLE